MKKYDIGVVVGRFQVPELHYAHIDFIVKVMEQHKKVILFIGTTSAKGTIENPMDYKTRQIMLQNQFPNIEIRPLADYKYDSVWSENLDKEIRKVFPKGSVCLYGGRDSFLKYYSGKFHKKEFKKKHHFSGTVVRKNCADIYENNKSFRSGIIKSTQDQYPRVFATVDMAIIKNYDGASLEQAEVLLGRKKNEKGWRFPGGFVDPTDLSLESAVKRELKEETCTEIDKDDLVYVSSRIVNDWRYTGRDKIMTIFFMAHLPTFQKKTKEVGNMTEYKTVEKFQILRANDDLEEVVWLPLMSLEESKMENTHSILLRDLHVAAVDNWIMNRDADRFLFGTSDQREKIIKKSYQTLERKD